MKRFIKCTDLPEAKLRPNLAASSSSLTWINSELSTLKPFSRLWTIGNGLAQTLMDWVNTQSFCVRFSVASNPDLSEAVGSKMQISPLLVKLNKLPGYGLVCVDITELMPGNEIRVVKTDASMIMILWRKIKTILVFFFFQFCHIVRKSPFVSKN